MYCILEPEESKGQFVKVARVVVAAVHSSHSQLQAAARGCSCSLRCMTRTQHQQHICINKHEQECVGGCVYVYTWVRAE